MCCVLLGINKEEFGDLEEKVGLRLGGEIYLNFPTEISEFFIEISILKSISTQFKTESGNL